MIVRLGAVAVLVAACGRSEGPGDAPGSTSPPAAPEATLDPTPAPTSVQTPVRRLTWPLWSTEPAAIRRWLERNGVEFGQVEGEIVSLSTDQIDANWLRCFRALPNLRSLTLQGRGFTDDDLVKLPAFEHLESVLLNVADCVRGPGLAWVGRCPNIRTLILSYTPVDGESMVHLSRLTKVELLILEGTRVTDAGLRQLGGLTNMAHLVLTGLPISDLSLTRQMTKLWYLKANKTRVGDDTLVNLRSLKALRTLDLKETEITDAGLEHLHGLSSLSTLSLPEAITGRGLRHLTGMAKHGVIFMETRKADRAAIRRFREQRPDVTVSTYYPAAD